MISAEAANRSFSSRELDSQSDRILAMITASIAGLSEWRAKTDPAFYAIMGDRGSGKTTLLYRLTEKAESDSQLLVAPMIRPDMLAASDSVLVSILSALLSVHGGNKSAEDSGLDAVGQNALRSAVVATSGSIEEILKISSSTGQFIADAASLLSRTFHFDTDFKTYVRELMAARKVKGIVVPIDDIDLAPSGLSRMLLEIRNIARTPGIFPVVCLTHTDLRASFGRELSSAYPSLSPGEVDVMVDQQVMKCLRPDHVFAPLQLPKNDILGFVPFGSTDTLGGVLKSVFSRIDPEGLSQVGVFLDGLLKHAHGEMLAYAWLPDTYRALEHLHFECTALVNSIDAKLPDAEIGYRLRSFVNLIRNGTPGFGHGVTITSAEREQDNPRFGLTVEWPDYFLDCSARGGWRKVFSSAGTRVMLRLPGRAYLKERVDPAARMEDRPRPRQAGRAETSRALMAQSILTASIFSASNAIGGFGYDQGDSDFLQVVRVYGLPTSDRLFVMPYAYGLAQTQRWEQTWRWIVEKSAPLGSSGTNPESAGANLVRAVRAIGLLGQSPNSVEAAQSLVSELDCAAGNYVSLCNSTGERSTPTFESNFCYWFEDALPLMFHDALLEADVLTDAVQIWQAAISTYQKSLQVFLRLEDTLTRMHETERRDAPSAVTKKRVWLYGYRELARCLSDDVVTMLNPLAKEYGDRAQQGPKGREAVEKVVSLSETGGAYRFRKNPTVEGEEQERQIRRLLDQFRQL